MASNFPIVTIAPGQRRPASKVFRNIFIGALRVFSLG
jgi:hypothetical protein